MTRTRFLAWPVGVLAALSGCAPAATSGVGRDLPVYAAPAPRPTFIEPSGAITLREALSLALLHNPALAADFWEVRAREAESIQAGRRPNPEVALALENLAGTGPFRSLEGVETTLALSQVIELGGKRGSRAAEARLERDLAFWDYEVRRIDVLAETAAAFVEVLAAQERAALVDTLVRVADEVLTSVSYRVSAGGVSPVEERRARVAVETSRVDRDRALRSLDLARARLGATWGSAAPIFDRAAGEIELSMRSEVPSFEVLAARLEESPVVARWTTERDRRRASRRLAESSGVPDLTVGAGLRHFNEIDEGALVFDVRMPLPLFDRSQDAVAAAERRIHRAQEQQRDARARVQFALASAHAALGAAANEAVALRDRILPEAQLAFTESHEAYTRGRLRLTDVLDAQRSAFELRGRYVDVLATYHVTVAEIERLLGTPLHDVLISRGTAR